MHPDTYSLRIELADNDGEIHALRVLFTPPVPATRLDPGEGATVDIIDPPDADPRDFDADDLIAACIAAFGS